MKRLTGFGLVILSIILALTSGTAFTVLSKDRVNATSSLNLTNATWDILQGAEAILNTTDVTSLQNTTGLQNSTVSKEVCSINNVSIIASINDPNNQPSNKTIFVIDDGVTPIKHAGKSQSSVNGASLMRTVDGTPHGYTTYYN